MMEKNEKNDLQISSLINLEKEKVCKLEKQIEEEKKKYEDLIEIERKK